jgi:Flp pilus assembly protein TadB
VRARTRAGHTGRKEPDSVTVSIDAARFRVVVGVPPDLRRLPDRAARAIDTARVVGSPVVEAIDAAIEAESDTRRRERAIEVATAQARSVAAGLALLPLVAVPGVGALIGEPLWRFYLTPVGGMVAIVGLATAGLGVAIAHGLIARAERAVCPGADEIADLVAIGLNGGLPPAAALRAAADCLPDHRGELRRAALALELGTRHDAPPEIDRIVDCLTEAGRFGAPAAPAMRRIGREMREASMHRALTAAERLPARLTFPTALFLMPAAVLLVGAPLIALGLSTVAGGGP